MSFVDEVLSTAQQGATTLATEWIKQTVEANKPKTQVQQAPAPAATLPADVQIAQQKQNSLVMYIAIGVALLGAAFLLFGGKKGGKK